MRITIVGAGAIGGIAGAWMSMAGEDVTFVDTNREHVEHLRTQGLLIDGGRGDQRLGPQRAHTPTRRTSSATRSSASFCR